MVRIHPPRPLIQYLISFPNLNIADRRLSKTVFLGYGTFRSAATNLLANLKNLLGGESSACAMGLPAIQFAKVGARFLLMAITT